MNIRKTISLLLLTLCVSYLSYAQDAAPAPTTATPAPAPAEDKTKFFDKIGHWIQAYSLSSEEFMQSERNEFKSKAFAEVYVEGLIDHKAWLWGMLNRVTKVKNDAKTDPYILFTVSYTPASDNFENYKVSYKITGNWGSKNVSVDLEKIQTATIKEFLTHQPYNDPNAAEADLTKAIDAALKQLEEKLGSELAPNIMVRFHDEIFWTGHDIPILDSDGNSIELEAIDKQLKPIEPSDLIWTNADKGGSKGIVDMSDGSSKTVTVSKIPGGEENEAKVTVKRAQMTTDIDELLKALIIEALAQKKTDALNAIVTLRQDSIANAKAAAELIAKLEAANFPLESDGTVPTPMYNNPVAVDSSSVNGDDDRSKAYKELKKRKTLRNTLRKKLNVVALANLIVEKPDQIKILLDGLLRNSGRLVAQLILQKDGDGRRDAARNIVVDFLNKNIEQIAGSSFQQTVPPEEVLPVVPITPKPPVFSADRYVYINPLAEFEGKAELERDLTEYLKNRSTPMYVFINYSQDNTTSGYLQRAKAGRPVGLPAGAEYKVYTLVNMPGSLLAQWFGGELGDPEKNGAKNVIDEVKRPEGEGETTADHVLKQLKSLEREGSFGFAIVHCEVCKTSAPATTPTPQPQRSPKVTPINISEEVARSIINSRFQIGNQFLGNPSGKPEDQPVLEKGEKIESDGKACFVLYFRTLNKNGDTELNTASGPGVPAEYAKDITAPAIMLFYQGNSTKIDCTPKEDFPWRSTICKSIQEGKPADTSFDGPYVTALVDHVVNCVQTAPMTAPGIYDFTTGRQSLQDQQLISDLYNAKQTIQTKDGLRHDTKAILIVTDQFTSEESMKAAADLKAPQGTVKIWIHKTKEQLWEVRSDIPDNSKSYFDVDDKDGKDAFTMDDFLKGVGDGIDAVATGLYEFFDWTSKGIGKAKIPEYVWNCNMKSGYQEKYAAIYKYSTGIFMPIQGVVREALGKKLKENIDDPDGLKCVDDFINGRVDLAFYAGVWNGFIGVGQSIPDLGKMLVGPLSRPGRNDFAAFLDQLEKFEKENEDGSFECRGTWCAIKTGLGEAFDPSQCCQFAELIGELVIPVAISFINPEATAKSLEDSGLRLVMKAIKIIQWIDEAGNPFNVLKVLKNTTRYVGKGISRVRNVAGQLLVEFENEVTRTTVKARILLEDGISDLIRTSDEVVLSSPDGVVLMAKYSETAGSGSLNKTARIISSDLGKELIDVRKASSKLLGKILQNDPDIEGTLNRIQKTALKEVQLNKFLTDLANNPKMAAKFRQLGVLGDEILDFTDAWRILDDAERAFLKVNPDVLAKLQSLLNKTELKRFIPIVTEKRNITTTRELIVQIVKLQNDASKIVGQRMSGMEDLIDDIIYFVDNTKGIPGAEDFMKELTETGSKMAGGAFVLKTLRRNGSKIGKVKEFEKAISNELDEIGDVVADIHSSNGHIEFKNWGSIPAKRYKSFTRQFAGYLYKNDETVLYFFKKGESGKGFVNPDDLKSAIAVAFKNNKEFFAVLPNDRFQIMFQIPKGVRDLSDADIQSFLDREFSQTFSLIE